MLNSKTQSTRQQYSCIFSCHKSYRNRGAIWRQITSLCYSFGNILARETAEGLRGIKNCIGLSSALVYTRNRNEWANMYDDKKERDIKSDDSADRVRVSIVSSSLARNRIRLSINTRNKVVNATITTTTKTADGKNEIGGTERQVEIR